MQGKHISNQQATPLQKDTSGFIQCEFYYLGNTIAVVFDTDHLCWISIPGVCKVLGLNARGQQQRISRTPELATGLSLLTIPTRGGPQRINCLRSELAASWLEGLRSAQQDTYAHFLQVLTEAVSAFQEGNGDNPQQLPESGLLYVSENDTALEPAAYQLPLPLEETISEQIEELQTVVTAALPGLGQVLVVTNYPEDRAIREATFARPTAWLEESTRRRPYYIASNEVRVSLGDPAHPLIIDDAQEALRNMQESTILTARYILGRWHIAREQDQLGNEGSVLIQAEELLEWRDIQPHSRIAYPGSLARQVDGYEQKYLDQIRRDIKLLELLHLQGQHRIMAGSQVRVLNIDGPYLRATHIQESESGQAAYFIAPGGWINVWIAATEVHGGLWIAELDRRIFKLHPHNDQIALRLALFLTEYWQIYLGAGFEVAPLPMEELLRASMISIDRTNLTLRFAPRVEAAIQKLLEQGIIGQACPQEPLFKLGHWGKAWLATPWKITPPAELVKLYDEANKGRKSAPLLLPSPPGQTPEKLKPYRRQKREMK